jgi:PLP dependent protein
MSDSRCREFLKSNLDTVEGRIQAACQRAGRQRSDVTLVAVTKSVSAEVAALLPELGVLDADELLRSAAASRRASCRTPASALMTWPC